MEIGRWVVERQVMAQSMKQRGNADDHDYCLTLEHIAIIYPYISSRRHVSFGDNTSPQMLHLRVLKLDNVVVKSFHVSNASNPDRCYRASSADMGRNASRGEQQIMFNVQSKQSMTARHCSSREKRCG